MSKQFNLSLSLLAGLGLLSGLAQAQTQLPPVDISAARADPSAALPPRVDVSHVCPNIAAALSSHLFVQPVERPIERTVRFNLVDGKVDQVRVRMDHQTYGRPVISAMRQVSCVDDHQPQQNFAFVLRIVPEDASGNAVAQIKLAPLLTAAARD